MADLSARLVADLAAENDLLRRGATVRQVELIDELARRLRDGSFSAEEVIAAAAAETLRGEHAELAFLLHRAGVQPGNARSLGRLLGRLKGEVVHQVLRNGDGRLWQLHWPRRCWRQNASRGPDWHPDDGGDADDARPSATCPRASHAAPAMP